MSLDDKAPSKAQLNNLMDYYQRGRYDDAEKLALIITKEFPTHHFSWKILGTLLGQSGRISESLKINQKAVELSPQDSQAHNNLGVTCEGLGRLEEAEISYKKAVALKPDFSGNHYNLANILLKIGRFEEAEASSRKAIELQPGFFEAHNNLGIALQELGRLDEAEVSYMKAITLKPDYVEAYNNLGNTFNKLGRIEEAEASFRQAITLNPDYARAYYNLGGLFQGQGRLGESEKFFKQATLLKPGYFEAYGSLGITLEGLSRFDEAEENYRKAIALEPDYSLAKHMLAALTSKTTTTAPLDYVEGLFDNYATKFENSLVDKLKYKIPRVVAEMILKDSKLDLLGSVIDLGCGTGLFGTEIKQFCEYLEGVDLSEKMLDVAKKKNVYNKLIHQDILAYLSNTSLNFDYFISTDVFVYIGDLSDVFRLIKYRNKSVGKLAFSTEDYDGKGFFLEKSGRYSHSKNYIESLCKEFGYKLQHFERQPLRKDKNRYITGGVYLLDF